MANFATIPTNWATYLRCFPAARTLFHIAEMTSSLSEPGSEERFMRRLTAVASSGTTKRVGGSSTSAGSESIGTSISGRSEPSSGKRARTGLWRSRWSFAAANRSSAGAPRQLDAFRQ
eukprot:scaffold46812_cov69-Phaeocystis_antarctica.AAC.1